jgi:chromosome partitioning protein
MQSLSRELRSPGFAEYDLVLIDCPPNLSLATRIALTASDYIVSPARPDYLATIGLGYFFDYYQRVVDAHNQDIGNSGFGVAAWHPIHLGIVFTMIQFSSPDRPYAQQEQYMQMVRRMGLPIFDAALRYNNSLYGGAGDGGVPVALLESLHPQVAQDIDMLGSEFLKRLSNREGKRL